MGYTFLNCFTSSKRWSHKAARPAALVAEFHANPSSSSLLSLSALIFPLLFICFSRFVHLAKEGSTVLSKQTKREGGCQGGNNVRVRNKRGGSKELDVMIPPQSPGTRQSPCSLLYLTNLAKFCSQLT